MPDGAEAMSEAQIQAAVHKRIVSDPGFGVYKAAWKVHQDYRVRRAALSYAAFRVGDEHATYDEVSTAPTSLRL